MEIQGVFYYDSLKGHTNSVLFIMSMYSVNFIIKKIHFLFLSLFLCPFVLFISRWSCYAVMLAANSSVQVILLSVFQWNYRYVPLRLAHQKILEKLQLKALQYSPKV